MTYLKSLQQKGSLPFSIVQVIPGTVIGPSELETSSSKAYDQMDRMAKALLFNTPKPRYAFGFVHVQDCAAIHIEALDEEKVPDSGIPDWFIAAASTPEGKEGIDIWRDAGDMVEAEFADEAKGGLFTVGRENLPINMPYRVDSKLTENLLLGGRRFKSLEACVREVGEWYSGLVEKEKMIIS